MRRPTMMYIARVTLQTDKHNQFNQLSQRRASVRPSSLAAASSFHVAS
jgi:hypothetical protein